MPNRRRQHDSTTRVVLPTVDAYERYAGQFLSRWGRRRYRRPPLLLAWLARLPPRATVLDLGCGGGQDATYLRARGHRVIGIDRAAALPLIQADLRHVPLHRGSLDGIWAAASLIHLPKVTARAVLLQVRGLARPGGILAASFTHGTKSRTLTRGWIPGRYVSRWKKDELGRAFRKAGWQVIVLKVVTGRERKGRWINVLAASPVD